MAKRGGFKHEQWGCNVQRDIDSVLHWRVDVYRAIEHLQMANDILVAVETELRQGNSSGDLMEGLFAVTKKVIGRTNTIWDSLRRRRDHQTEKSFV